MSDIDYSLTKKPNPFRRGGSVMYQSPTLLDPLASTTALYPASKVYEETSYNYQDSDYIDLYSPNNRAKRFSKNDSNVTTER